MRQIRLTVAYDGTEFAGWQSQVDQRTAQDVLEAAITQATGITLRVIGCGRTDAGVHALRQTVTFRYDGPIPGEAFRPALNRFLPGDLTVLESREVPYEFHPIRDIVRKRYRYLIHDGKTQEPILRRYCWLCRFSSLDVDAMRDAATSLVGKHDFTSFATTGTPRTTHVRTVFDLTLRRASTDLFHPLLAAIADPDAESVSPLIEMEIEADGFLYNMVRNIVGTLVDVGRGAKPASWVADVLEQRDRTIAGPTAPPQGLYMVKTVYP